MKICLTLRVWYVHGILQKVPMHVLTYHNEKQISNDKLIKKFGQSDKQSRFLAGSHGTLPAFYEQINEEKGLQTEKKRQANVNMVAKTYQNPVSIPRFSSINKSNC